MSAPAEVRPVPADVSQVVTIPDVRFRQCLEWNLNVEPGTPLTRADLATRTQFYCDFVKDVTGLEHMINLRELSLSYSKLILDLPESLTKLESLALRHNELTQLTIPDSAVSLTSIDVSSNFYLDSLTIPDTHTQLRSLDLHRNGLIDLALPTSLPNLEHLDVSFNRLSNFSMPRDSVRLRTLSVAANSLTALVIPGNLPALTSLDASYNQLSHITIPDTSNALEIISLTRNLLVSFTVPRTLTALEELYVGGNQLSHFTIPNAPTLKQLNLESNHLTNISLPADLKQLEWLILNGNQLTSVRIPGTLTNLRSFTATDNHIADLSGLSGLPLLREARAAEQTVALPNVQVGQRFDVPLRDRSGAHPTIVATKDVTVTNNAITYAAPGVYTLSFSNADGSFSGTLVQRVLPLPSTFGDHTGDGVGDIFVITPRGQLGLLTGSTTGWADHVEFLDEGWETVTHLAQIGDVTGDNSSDLLARRGTDHSLWTYRSDGAGYLSVWGQAGKNWGGMDQIVPAGNLDGGATQYVVARRASDGALFRYSLTAQGLTDIKHVGQNWNGMRQILSVGDFNNDGRSDLLAIRHDGTLWSYLGTATGGIGSGRQVGRGWGNFIRAFNAGDLSGDGVVDLVGQRDDGAVFTYANLRGRWGIARQINGNGGGYRIMA